MRHQYISIQEYLKLEVPRPTVFYRGQLVQSITQDTQYKHSTRYILRLALYSVGAKRSDTQIEIVRTHQQE